MRLISRLRRRLLPGGQQARGSMAVEFVVVAPAFALLLLLVSAGGQWVNVTGQVGGAARDAARAASIGRSGPEALAQAQQAARGDLAGKCTAGPGGVPQVTVTPMTGGAVTTFATAAAVQVRVSCDVSLSVFRLIGFPASRVFSDAAVAPLDSFVCRTGAIGC
jgi:Flp pilus assembly protein TadG